MACFRVVLAVLSGCRGLGTGGLDAGCKLKVVRGRGAAYEVGWK